MFSNLFDNAGIRDNCKAFTVARDEDNKIGGMKGLRLRGSSPENIIHSSFSSIPGIL